ncbi:Multidrug resistance regulator 1 [Meyerozyma sp. JA9]|nr:Multidrug resistance regulator 1 [Meyerozyma sp. JA9]
MSKGRSQKELDELRDRVRTLEGIVKSQQQQLTSSTFNDQRDDITLDLSKAFDGLTVKNSVLLYVGPTSYTSLFMNDTYSMTMFEDYTKSQLQQYREQYEMSLPKRPYSDSAKPSDASQIVSDLPPLNIVMFLLERFFQICYPFAPFINKGSFMEEVEMALEQRGYHTILTVEGKQLQATIALVLIMMRFAYLTLPIRQYYSNSLQGNLHQMIKEMIQSSIEIRPSYVSRANILVFAAGCFNKVTLRAIQAALLLRTYRSFCPESNESGTESSILVGCLIQMARFHGIHKDAYSYGSSLVDTETKHLWSKIWAQLVFLDASQAFNLGGQLIIYEDNNFPFLVMPGVSIVEESPLILRNFALKAQVSQIIRNLIKSMGKGGSTKRSSLSGSANEIKLLLCNKIRMFDQLYYVEEVIDNDTCGRALEFCLRLDLTYKLFIIDFLLYTSADDLLESYLKQKYFVNVIEYGLIILRIGVSFCDTPHSFFGPQLEKLIAQSIFLALYRTMVFTSSIVLRSMDGTLSLNNAVKTFSSADSSGLVAWLNIDFNDEQVGLRTLIKKLQHLYHCSKELASTYFTGYSVSWGMRNVLEYFRLHFPILMDDEDQSILPDQFNDVLFNLDEMWKNETVINFDNVFAGLNSEVNDLQQS